MLSELREIAALGLSLGGEVGVDVGAGEQRDQSHHRPHLEQERLTIGKAEAVVVEDVLFVPQSSGVQGMGDPSELLEEVNGFGCIRTVLAG